MTRILIVEDDTSVAMALQDDLGIEGFEVDITSEGNDALARMRQTPYDLVVLDLMLPDKDGYEVCRELRSSGSGVPIIMLTARAQESDLILGLDIGADDYVTKPFSPKELRARIRAALRRTDKENRQLFRFDDFELDMKRFELRRAGKPVRLTPIEFRLLAALAQNAGQVLTRDRLLDLVWGPDVFIADRVVDAHITNLRKKIEPKRRTPRYVICVRGMGYRFDGSIRD
jgi:DNA-binding response OmpR family regulator